MALVYSYSLLDTDSLLDIHDTTLRSALDKHAPLIQKKIKSRTLKPWIDEEVLIERRKRRKLERIMRTNKTEQTISDYKCQKNRVNHLSDQKKSKFLQFSNSKVQRRSEIHI